MRFGVVDLGNVLNSLGNFDTSKFISSPRVHTKNNQQAIFAFTTNHIYFTSDIQKEIRKSNHGN